MHLLLTPAREQTTSPPGRSSSSASLGSDRAKEDIGLTAHLKVRLFLTGMQPDDGERPAPVLHRDPEMCIPFSRILAEGDLLCLLTPILPAKPSEKSTSEASDPFEPLGRALAKHHPWIRHVPYTPHGITDTHRALVHFARAVVFVISGPPSPCQPSQVALSEIARLAGEHRPQVVIACCRVGDLTPFKSESQTLVEIPSYSPRDLELVADFLFDGDFSPPRYAPASTPESNAAPSRQMAATQAVVGTSKWLVAELETAGDILQELPAIQDLWSQCLPAQFQLSKEALQSLLIKTGYAKHFVVRDSAAGRTGALVGFCATFTNYMWDINSEDRFGSLAMLIVKPSHRGRGIGSALHKTAMEDLKFRHECTVLQLGSNFPRLLAGLPSESAAEGWFSRRGWDFDRKAPGRGQEACDWILDLNDWRTEGLASSGLKFRSCRPQDFRELMRMVANESRKHSNMGWCGHYGSMEDISFFPDIVLALEDDHIVASAIIYTATDGSPSSADLPWALTIGTDVGGATCICIAEDKLSTANSKNSVLIRLLDACVTTLRRRGMRNMLIDSVRGGDEGFQSIGFHRWARYREVWRNAK